MASNIYMLKINELILKAEAEKAVLFPKPYSSSSQQFFSPWTHFKWSFVVMKHGHEPPRLNPKFKS